MASVELRRGKTRNSYLVRWRDEVGKSRRKSFPRRADADRYRAQVEHSLNTGAYVDPAAGRVTFRSYAEAWRLAQPHRPNTAARVASQQRRHVYPVLGGRRIAAVRPSEVQAFVTGLSGQLSPSSVRTVFQTVRSVFTAAVRDRVIGRNPCDRIALPEVERKRIVPLTVDQVQALVDALPERYRVLAIVMAGAGPRQGEAFGLQLADVDFLRGRSVRIDRQVQPVAGGGAEAAPLKNRAAYRVVPLGEVVLGELAGHVRRYPPGDDGWLFTTPDGAPLVRTWFNQAVWRPARTAAGLPAVTCHDLRHFYASALIRAGQSVKAVSARLGHSNAAITLNTYAHLWPDDEDNTRRAIDDLFRGAPAERREAGLS